MRAVATLVWLTVDMGVPSWLHSEAWLCMRRLTGAVSARTWLHCTTAQHGPGQGRLLLHWAKIGVVDQNPKRRPFFRFGLNQILISPFSSETSGVPRMSCVTGARTLSRRDVHTGRRWTA